MLGTANHELKTIFEAYLYEDTFQAKEEPALLEIEDKLKSTEFREFWNRKIVDKHGYLAWGYAGSYALGAAINPLAGISAALLATGTFIKAGQIELKEKVNEIERNCLYFYYQVKKHVDQNN